MSVLDNITKHVRRLGLTGSGQSTRKLDDAESRGPGSEMGNKVPGSPTEEVKNSPNEGCPPSINACESEYVMVAPPSRSGHDTPDAVPVQPSLPVPEPPSLPSPSSSNEWFNSVEFSERIAEADVFVIHSDEDEKEVHKLKQLLTKFVTLSDGRKLVFFPSSVPQWDKVKWFNAALEHSKFKFIYINQQHVDDPFLEHQHHGALWKKIQDHDQSIVPVKAHYNVRLPSLLGMFRAIDIGRLLRGKTLNEIHDVGELKNNDVDLYFFNSVYKMFASPSPTPSQQPSAPAQNFVSLLRPNYKYLVDHIDPDNGLLAELLSVGVLSLREMETIKVEKTFYDRNEHLLRLFMQRKTDVDFEKFVNALRANDQHHIADFLQTSSSCSR